MPRLGVVTSIVGSYDMLKEPVKQSGDVKFVCYTTIKSSRPSTWQRVYVDECTQGGRRSNMMLAKYYKMHLLNLPELMDCDVVMWVDGSFAVQDLPTTDILEADKLLGVFTHSKRDSLTEEVQYCANNTNEYLRARYHDQNMYWQLAKYLEDGYDVTRPNLYEMGNFVVRRDDRVKRLLAHWYAQNCLYTFQDQLSFPYSVWSNELDHAVQVLGTDIFTENSYAVYHPHDSSSPPRSSSCLIGSTSSGLRSYDCFDTLIVRAHTDPHRVFDYMALAMGIPDFKKNRLACESSTLLETYRTMQAKGYLVGHSVQLMALYEHYLEVARSALNRDALREFQPGDMVLTDTVWTSSQVEDMLSHWNIPCGDVVAAPNGKRHGDSFRRLDVEWHLGDNKTTDVDAALQHGTIGRLYTGSQYTWRESYLSTLGLDTLAGLSRVMRLSNPFDSEADDRRHMWALYSQVWMPLCVLMVKSVRELAKGRPVVYLARDMFLAYKVHQAIWPNESIHYLQFSRRASSHASDGFLNYVRETVPEDAVVVDLQGRGKTFTEFRLRYNIPIHVLVTVFSGDTGIRYDRHVRLSLHYNDYIERMYYSNHGSVHDLDMFYPLEYDTTLVDVYMSLMAQTLRRRVPLVVHELQEELEPKMTFHEAAVRLMKLSVDDVRLMASIHHVDDHLGETPPDKTSSLSPLIEDKYEEFIGEYRPYQVLSGSTYVTLPGRTIDTVTYSPVPQRIDPDVVRLEQNKRTAMQPFGKTLAMELASMLPLRGGKLLDFACGLSHACEDAHKSRDFHAVRVDASSSVCRHLSSTNPHNDTILCASSLGSIHSCNFDVVFLGEFLMCEPHYQCIVEQAIRRLKSGGHLIITTYYDANSPSHVIQFNQDRYLMLCADQTTSLRRFQRNEDMHNYTLAVYRKA